MGLDFTLFATATAFQHTPDAILDYSYIYLIVLGIVSVIWIIPTIILSLKIARYGHKTPPEKSTREFNKPKASRHESNEIMSRPEYGTFLAENPDRQYLYWEDLPVEFEKWLHHVKNTEQIAATDRHQHHKLEPTTELPRRR